MSEDDLLIVLQNANVRIGNLNPCIIKAWFDTDFHNLLSWMCSAISADCCISAQEQSEYDELDCILTTDQLNSHIEIIEAEFPDIFQTELNLCNLDIANCMIEVLEEQHRDYDQQLQVNQNLYENLLKEYSKLSSEEIQSQLEEESAQESCMKLSNQLDNLNHQTFNQLLQYKNHLNNYEESVVPVFITNIDLCEFERKFLNVSNSHITYNKFDSNFLETSVEKPLNILSGLGARIFDSTLSNLAIQVEIGGLHSVLKCLECYNFNILSSLNNINSIQTSIEINNGQHEDMLKEIETETLKFVEDCVNRPVLKYSQSELAFLKSKSNHLNNFFTILMKMFFHFIIIYNLYLQEQLDIRNSSQFFKKICKYINFDIQDSNFRKEGMLKIISDYESFCSKSIEDKFKLVSDFGRLTNKTENFIATKIFQDVISMRTKKEKLEKQHFSAPINTKILHKSIAHVQILQDFLVSDCTDEIIVVPYKLQLLFHDVNKSLDLQKSALKFLLEETHKLKEKKLKKNKWLLNRQHLWMYYITDGQKLINFLDQIKTDAKEKQISK